MADVPKALDRKPLMSRTWQAFKPAQWRQLCFLESFLSELHTAAFKMMQLAITVDQILALHPLSFVWSAISALRRNSLNFKLRYSMLATFAKYAYKVDFLVSLDPFTENLPGPSHLHTFFCVQHSSNFTCDLQSSA